MYSDPKRVKEFITYFLNTDLDKYTQYHVFELIVASYNDAILENLDNEMLKAAFGEAVNKSNTNPNLDILKNYWRRIYNEDEFPVGKLLL